MSKTILGLSFGNTSSSIAFTKDGKVEVIANPDGDREIPSMLAYVHGDELHGLQAKHQLIRNAKSVVAYFRDFLGEKFADIDPTPCHRSAHPEEQDNTVGFAVNDEFISVGEATKRHLNKLKDAAVDYIGKEIDGVVLTVPSNWNDAKRALLKKASEAAGLPVQQIINEETAALLAHTSREANFNDRIFVVADFGHLRSDGAVVAYNGGIFTTLATLHDTELGGRNIDEALVEYLASEFEKANKVDPRGDDRAVAKLLQEAEQLKKTLSNSTSTNFGVESVTQGIDFMGSLNRLRFEMVGRAIFTRFANFVQTLVKKANLDVLDINEVLLVGGTSWIPKVSSTIGALFDDDTTLITSPSTDTRAIAPDELISRGAAVQGSLTSGYDADEIQESLEPQVINGPHLAKPIGIVGVDNTVVEVLSPNTLIPIRKQVSVDANGPVSIKIVEIETEIETKTVKPEPQEKDEDESDWSDDDEEYEVRTRVLKPGKELAVLGINAHSIVDIIFDITRDLKLNIAARSGQDVVKGSV